MVSGSWGRDRVGEGSGFVIGSGPDLVARLCEVFQTSLRAMAKAMKAMKRVSKFAKGRMAKSVVFRGTKASTVGGLTKANLTKNKNGKIVSKKQSAAGKKAYSFIKGWTAAVTKARKALNVKGFVAVKKGTALYKKAKEFYAA